MLTGTPAPARRAGTDLAVLPSRTRSGQHGRVHPAHANDVAFLTPGLVHEFGNLLLSIQGHALQWNASGAHGQPAILQSCERGARALRLFRHLLGENGAEPADAASTLAALADLLRVPVRERGHALEVQPAAGACAVDLASFVPLLVGGVRALLTAVPDGHRGTVSLGLQQTAEGLVVAVRHRAAAGALPFRPAADDAARYLRALIGRRQWPFTVSTAADGIDLVQASSDAREA